MADQTGEEGHHLDCPDCGARPETPCPRTVRQRCDWKPKDNGPAPLGWRCTSCLTGLGGHEIALGSLCTECRLAALSGSSEQET